MARDKERELDLVLKELRLEFIGTADEMLQKIERTIRARETLDSMEDIARDAHNLKGMGATFDFPLLSVIAHRLEDYLKDLFKDDAPLSEDENENILVFVDRMHDVLDGKLGPDDSESAAVLRTLPTLKSTQKPRDVVREVLLVMPRETATTIAARRMQSRGYRVVTVHSTIDAFRIAKQLLPDFVLAAAVMPELDGIDFSCALRAMSATRNIPVALITSFDSGDSVLQALPAGVPLIHKGDPFEVELDSALNDLYLT